MAVGLIAEYNPFHNGHQYQIDKIKELFPNEEIILVLSGNYTQRGEVSIIHKWKKCEIALKAGIDLVVELPFVCATQSADLFSYGAVTLLERLKVDKLVFGSESDSLEELETIAKCQIENEDFEKLVKIYSKFGNNYPTAISNAIYDLTGKRIDTPNDLLGVSYIKTILKNNYLIKPFCIKRTTDYHDKAIGNISSATAIRKALKEGKDIKEAVPAYVLPYLQHLHFIEDYFELLKYKIITDSDLSRYQTVDEGIENKLKKEILNCHNYQDLIYKIKTKRYTYNKISRMLLHILVGMKKDFADKNKEIEYIRILGFNQKGRDYLNKVKKEMDIKVLSKFERNCSEMLDFELYTTSIYDLINNENLTKEEYKNHLGGIENEKNEK